MVVDGSHCREKHARNQGYKSIHSAQHGENQATKWFHWFREPGMGAGPSTTPEFWKESQDPSASRME